MGETRNRKRNFLITINNPKDKNLDHNHIKDICNQLGIIYGCMCDEIGLETHTYHTHLLICFKNPIEFTTIVKAFENNHVDACKGSIVQNRDYIRKEGKYKDSEKSDTNLIDTFEEWGEMPSAKNDKMSTILELIEEGYKPYEIIKEYPKYGFKINELNRLYIESKNYQYSHKRYDRKCIYIYGPSRTGKTSYVLNEYGDNNVYRINSYNNPFDGYDYENIMLFDEFHGQIKITEMLNYLDPYSVKLPCRYADKCGAYEIAFIVSNIPIDSLYRGSNIDDNTRQAFINRISEYWIFDKDRRRKYDGVELYHKDICYEDKEYTYEAK